MFGNRSLTRGRGGGGFRTNSTVVNGTQVFCKTSIVFSLWPQKFLFLNLLNSSPLKLVEIFYWCPISLTFNLVQLSTFQLLLVSILRLGSCGWLRFCLVKVSEWSGVIIWKKEIGYRVCRGSSLKPLGGWGFFSPLARNPCSVSCLSTIVNVNWLY